MLVSLVKSSRIKTIVMPKDIIGNHWITDYDENNNEHFLVNIEACNGVWKLVSNEDVVVIENNVVREFVYLKEYSFYLLKVKQNNTYLLLYCCPFYDKTFKRYYIAHDQTISIGNHSSNDIYYNNSGVDEVQAKLIYRNGAFIIIDNNSRLGTYVNNIRLRNQYLLKSGDVIFVAGLKIIVLLEVNTPVLIINNPDNLVNLREQTFKEYRVNSSKELVQNDNMDDIINVKLYKPNDYFYRKDYDYVENKMVDINLNPPKLLPGQIIMASNWGSGPMLTTGLASATLGLTSVASVMAQNGTWLQAMPTISVSLAMLGSLCFWPSLTHKYEIKKQQQAKTLAKQQYDKYIEVKKRIIEENIKKQKMNLVNNYISLADCQKVILERKDNLWCRQPDNDDFLLVSLGIGTLPVSMNVQFSEDDNLTDIELKRVISDLNIEKQKLVDVPINISLYSKRIISLIGNKKLNKNYVERLLIQLVTLHDYDKLKVVLFTSRRNEQSWDYLKILPHMWSNDKSIRFFATDIDEAKELDRYLEHEFYLHRGHDSSKHPYYLIITDNITNVHKLNIIQNILGNSNNLGFGLIILSEKKENLPTECQTYINVSTMGSQLIEEGKSTNFKIDFDTKINMYTCVKALANIPIWLSSNVENLPKDYDFLTMYDASMVEHLNVMNHWLKNNHTLTLQAPVGIGPSGEKISIDLHKNKDGANCLIVGPLSSGKTELIATYVLSMAVNYHPCEVQFILIDTKNKQLTNAFDNLEQGVRLPHLVGTISELTNNEMTRFLTSINLELKKRQHNFSKAGDLVNESTIDIYKYQELYNKGIVKENISHLFIICDDFDDLENNEPTFAQQLVNMSKVGYLFGIHVILSMTNSLNIIHNYALNSNCLVIDLYDIEDTYGNNLKNWGYFRLKKQDEVLASGKLAGCRLKYLPCSQLKKVINTTIDFIDNVGTVFKRANCDEDVSQGKVTGDILNNVVTHLFNMARENNINIKPLWLNSLSEYIIIANLIRKYHIEHDDTLVAPIIGEYDDILNQKRGALRINFTLGGNTVIYSVDESDKEQLISSMLFSSMYLYTPEELNYYILDFGSGFLENFQLSPLIGDIVNSSDKIGNLYKMLRHKLEERKKKFVINDTKKILPAIVVIINNFNLYENIYSLYEEKFLSFVQEGYKYGIYFVITCNGQQDIPIKIRYCFKQQFVLKQDSEMDYISILGNINHIYPSPIKGRGITKLDEMVCEFQTAYCSPQKKEKVKFIQEQCASCFKEYGRKAETIPMLPEHLSFKDVRAELGKSDAMVIGYNEETLDIVKYDFSHRPLTIITSEELSLCANFVKPLIKQFAYLNRTDVVVIDAEDLQLAKDMGNLKYINDNFEHNFIELNRLINQYYDIYVHNSFDKDSLNSERPVTVFICGLESFEKRLSLKNKKLLPELFSRAKDIGIVNFIITDSIDKIEKFKMEEWYNNNINRTTGIWVGNGLEEQLAIKIYSMVNNIKGDIPDNYCYVIARGRAILTQYIEDFNTIDDKK